MPKTCKTCKWWETDKPGDGYYMQEGWCPCRISDEWLDWFADFNGCETATSPDFGCIHHQPKQEEKE